MKSIEHKAYKITCVEVSLTKRKLSNLSDIHTVEASPGKIRKLNFTQNLSFWRKLEGRGDTLSQTGQTNSAVRVKTSTYDEP